MKKLLLIFITILSLAVPAFAAGDAKPVAKPKNTAARARPVQWLLKESAPEPAHGKHRGADED